jgi:transposase
MLTVDDFAQIRQARRDGLSIRQLTKRFGHSPKTILKVLGQAEPKPYTLSKPRSAPVFDKFRPIVDEILEQDRTAPPKQRHTAKQLYRRLVYEHGYTGSYHPVQRYVKQLRLERRETFIPLEHPLGHRLEADFGHIYVDFPELRRQIPVLIVTPAGGES